MKLNEPWAIIIAAIITGIFAIIAAFIATNGGNATPAAIDTSTVSVSDIPTDILPAHTDISPSEAPKDLPSSLTAIPITPTELPSDFPTPEVYSVVLKEQIFERGRMIWFEPLRQIWVLKGETIDPISGTWACYSDEYSEGQPESDSTMNPPAGITTPSQFPDAFPQQPIRAFGQLWRENADIRNTLGWAITSEIRYTTRYEYHAGGELVNGKYEATPGEYRITSVYQDVIILFTEDLVKAPCELKSGAWHIK